MLRDLGHDLLWLPKLPGQEEEAMWWPVGVLVFEEDLSHIFGDKIVQYRYLICIYQAIDPVLTAWGMSTTKLVDVSAQSKAIMLLPTPSPAAFRQPQHKQIIFPPSFSYLGLYWCVL